MAAVLFLRLPAVDWVFHLVRQDISQNVKREEIKFTPKVCVNFMAMLQDLILEDNL